VDGVAALYGKSMMNTQQQEPVTGDYVTLAGETYYQIANSHLMPDFFMSLVGASDHWMFVSSNGALTAGRQNADNALFPYAADDQISAARAKTGSTTLIRVSTPNGEDQLWEPFAAHSVGREHIRQNLYKTPLGTKLVFEEINDQLSLVFRYRWVFSEAFGFVRSCTLQNVGEGERAITLLDGLQDILPYGVASDFMMRFSNLGNAYKKSELLEESGLGLFLLSSIPTDRAEPSEGLKATTVWQAGLKPDAVLLSADQVPAFRSGQSVQTETDVRGKAGAYLISKSINLAPTESVDWHIVAELAQDHSDVIGLNEWVRTAAEPVSAINRDVDISEQAFAKIVSSSDGLQCGANVRRVNRHLSNTVFNVMRGGIPLHNYQVDAADFREHVGNFNQPLREKHAELLNELPDSVAAQELQSLAGATGDADLCRLAKEYLPLAFSRRHGDPTRPWNRFSIDLRSADGRTNLNYQGNWRDIFQNWEALAFSYPKFSTAMICRFVNATTADGYNPYRVTKDGFDWEEPTPDDPWANIGYWGDHQIIYLLKLLEWNRRVEPQNLATLLNTREFVHANVPYRIKSFEHIKQDPQSTIDFDADLSKRIAARVSEIGVDGKLLWNKSNEVHRVTLLEKLLTLSMAKLSNFIPDGGIWLNTQRPEWNDANNALVGNGLSMVTVYYLHRWFDFLASWLEGEESDSFEVSTEVADFFRQISEVLAEHSGSLETAMTPSKRAEIVTALSNAGSDYRNRLYEVGVSGDTTTLSREECLNLFHSARQHLQATIRNNRREDGLYHAYNLLDWRDDGLHVEHLYEMLEGQVAVLTSGVLTAKEAVELLDALRESALYRANQDSYMLYPDRQLPRFLDKNTLTDKQVSGSELLRTLLADGDSSIVHRDTLGGVHFNGQFRNAAELGEALGDLPVKYEAAANSEKQSLMRLFEDVFEHRQFTGRSGTFFAYEGLGSIYWHMVSKLGLAVSENYFSAIDNKADSEVVSSLETHFQSVRAGIGAEKTPLDYGAFPSDPYSHTPENAGVKQPGMTGQVKEDVLSRFAEIGVHVQDGRIQFRFDLFDRAELLSDPKEFTFCNLDGELQAIEVAARAFAFTLCQVPVTYRLGKAERVSIAFANGETRAIDGLVLDVETTEKVFSRSGEVLGIECELVSV
jgi:hypothetical protein